MRRAAVTLTPVLMVLVLIPASAVARSSHRRHHGRVHHARIKRFGSDVSSGSTSQSSSNTAGKVQSFNNGVLTIMLGDGSMASGVVNGNTELECTAAETETVHMDGDGGSGDRSGDGDQSGSGDDQAQGSGDQSATEDQGDAAEQNESQAEDQNENDAAEQNENENEAANSCSSANLTPGTVVQEAELSISSAGSVWKKVELES